jgi:D-amino-acid dehydrogenase
LPPTATGRHLNHAIKARDAILRFQVPCSPIFLPTKDLACDFDQRGVLMAFTDPAAMEGYEKTNRLLEPFGLAATFHDRKGDPAARAGAERPGLRRLVPSGGQPPETGMADDRLDPGSPGIKACGSMKAAGWTGSIPATDGSSAPERPPADSRPTSSSWPPAPGHRPLAANWASAFPSNRARDTASPWIGRPSAPGYHAIWYERNVVVTPWQSGYRLGGTMEFSGFDSQLNERRLGNLETSAALYLQTPVGRRVTERWTGLRPMSVDDLPIIDRMPNVQTISISPPATACWGLSTATGTGRLIADMILGRQPLFDPAPFSISDSADGRM